MCVYILYTIDFLNQTAVCKLYIYIYIYIYDEKYCNNLNGDRYSRHNDSEYCCDENLADIDLYIRLIYCKSAILPVSSILSKMNAYSKC